MQHRQQDLPDRCEDGDVLMRIDQVRRLADQIDEMPQLRLAIRRQSLPAGYAEEELFEESSEAAKTYPWR